MDLPPAILPLLTRCRALLQRHPRRVAGGVLALLAGFAVTAFGIAPMAPDAADLPRRLVSEPLAIEGLAAQLDALASRPLDLYRSELTRPGDTADTLLRRLGVADPAAAAFIRQDREARRLVDGRGSKMVQARSAADGTLLELVARFPALDGAKSGTHFTRLTLARRDGRLSSTLETAALAPQVRLGSGTIRSSLWAAADEARLPDAVAGQMVELFSGDIDFHRQLKSGDSFSVVYETLTADDQPVHWGGASGRVLAAEFINAGRSHQAVWFGDGRGGKGGYYGFDGRSRHRAFLASPVAFSRVTSGFAMRFHPIMHDWRAHNGIDYGAPKGTAVMSVADGVVSSAGWASGYGNRVQVQHAGGQATVYAHLSRIDVKPGQRVEQSQRIGAVGATGWATGPHLHFEFHVNGRVQDPLKAARNSSSEAAVVDAAARPAFQRVAAAARQQLSAAEALLGTRGDAE